MLKDGKCLQDAFPRSQPPPPPHSFNSHGPLLLNKELITGSQICRQAIFTQKHQPAVRLFLCTKLLTRKTETRDLSDLHAQMETEDQENCFQIRKQYQAPQMPYCTSKLIFQLYIQFNSDYFFPQNKWRPLAAF